MIQTFKLFVIGALIMRLAGCGHSGGADSSSTNVMPQDTTKTLISIQVNPTNPTIYLGIPQHFTATGTYTDGSSSDITGSVNWSSESTGVATIDSTGVATPENAGQTTITATDPVTLISANTVLTVSAAVIESLAISPTNPRIYLGTNESFTATGTFSDGESKDITTSVTWSSENTAVATINESTGVATAVSEGQAVIKAAVSESIFATTTLYVTESAHFVVESQFAQSESSGSVSSALDPTESNAYYVAYINTADNNYAYYATESNGQWVYSKIGGAGAPSAKESGSIVSIAITNPIESGYGHIWVAYEMDNDYIALVADDEYVNTTLKGSSPSIAVDPKSNHICIAYRDYSSQRVLLKCLAKEGDQLSNYNDVNIVNQDGGNKTNNIHLAFNPGTQIPFILFDDGNNNHQPRVKFYNQSGDWNDACGQGDSSTGKGHFASIHPADETALAFNDSGSKLTVAYIQSSTQALHVSTCITSNNGKGSDWERSDQSISNQSGISIAINPENSYLYVSSNDNGKLALWVCTDGTIGTCNYYTVTSSAQPPSIAGTPYATSLTLDANGLPAVAYLDTNYFISMVAGTATYQ